MPNNLLYFIFLVALSLAYIALGLVILFPNAYLSTILPPHISSIFGIMCCFYGFFRLKRAYNYYTQKD